MGRTNHIHSAPLHMYRNGRKIKSYPLNFRKRLDTLAYTGERQAALGRIITSQFKGLSREYAGSQLDDKGIYQHPDDPTAFSEEDSDPDFEDMEQNYIESYDERANFKRVESKNPVEEMQAKSQQEAPVQRPGVPDGTDPNNPVRLYADGVFDMYHIGHAQLLKQVKMMFPHTTLVVGVSGDEDTIKHKGKIVMNETERSEILKHCKWVDEVICPCPWVISMDFLKANNIHYVAHDDIPYTMGANAEDDIYYAVKQAGMFKATMRTEGISTSDVILRIIKDYDLYIWRSLKRGYSPKELGITKLKAQQLMMKDRYLGLKKKLKQQPFNKTLDDGYSQIKKQLTKIISQIEAQSEKLKQNFVSQYVEHPRLRLRQLINNNKGGSKRTDADDNSVEVDNDRVLTTAGTIEIKSGEKTWDVNPEQSLVAN